MPRTARASVGGVCYHVMNRGNDRRQIFLNDDDYAGFLQLISKASARLYVPVLSFCLMPNHFHMVLRPRGDDDLGRWMHWLLTSHVRRHRKRRGGSGHIYQGRFKAFPIQSDGHLLTVLRYVERNPLRAELVRRAQNWPWSSLKLWDSPDRPAWLCDSELPRPQPWTDVVNLPQTQAEMAMLQRSIDRGTPFGELKWIQDTARRLGLEYTLNPRGRPRKHAAQQPKEAEK